VLADAWGSAWSERWSNERAGAWKQSLLAAPTPAVVALTVASDAHRLSDNDAFQQLVSSGALGVDPEQNVDERHKFARQLIFDARGPVSPKWLMRLLADRPAPCCTAGSAPTSNPGSSPTSDTACTKSPAPAGSLGQHEALMGSWGLLGWGIGGLVFAAWMVWLTGPPPWLAVTLGGLGVLIGWAAGLLTIDRLERERGDDDGD
jgi:hypothetical protein